VIRLLLDYKADPNLLCIGHSALSLVIGSGNDLVNWFFFIVVFYFWSISTSCARKVSLVISTVTTVSMFITCTCPFARQGYHN
jgi:hypothetical protein